MTCASMLCSSDSLITLQDAMFRVVAAILHVDNIEFEKGKEIDSSVSNDEMSQFHL